MHQEEIVERVQTALEKALVKSNAARTFTVQTLLPGAQEKINSAKKKAEEGGEEEGEDQEERVTQTQRQQQQILTMKTKTTQREKAGGDHKLVRTNPTKDMASLDAFYRKTSVGGGGSASDVAATTGGENREDVGEELEYRTEIPTRANSGFFLSAMISVLLLLSLDLVE